jgi:thiamine biosynthesis lipoprotein
MTGLARRRFLALAGVAAGLGSLAALGKAPRPAVAWRGFALGGPARLVLLDGDRTQASRVLQHAAAEIARLEAVFSLHRPASELARLNSAGRLDRPSHDMVVLLSRARDLAAATGGAFDPTVQPVWRVLAAHFATRGATTPPDPRAIATARALVGIDDVAVSARRVALARPGMALTLNGIAQGYIADRIATLLRDAGYVETLVDTGEIVAGPRADGTWTVTGVRRLRVTDAAVATSSPDGTVFEPTGHFHHLIDPRTGACPRHVGAVTVVAPDATLADALSTALAIAAPDEARAIAAAFPGVAVHVKA